jgi:hypothetical protein
VSILRATFAEVCGAPSFTCQPVRAAVRHAQTDSRIPSRLTQCKPQLDSDLVHARQSDSAPHRLPFSGHPEVSQQGKRERADRHEINGLVVPARSRKQIRKTIAGYGLRQREQGGREAPGSMLGSV